MEKKCLRCGAEVERGGAKANNKKYCSDTCRDTAYTERNREKHNAWQRARWQRKAKGEKIQCLICGEEHRQVGSHIVQRHKMTAREYREKYGFDVKRGQLPKDLRKKKADYVFENNTVENLKAGKKYYFKKAQKGIGKYKRSEQTEKRLKEHWNKISWKGRKNTKVDKMKINCAECGVEKEIYPRHYKKNNNFCGVKCRNISNNKKRYKIKTY